MHDLEYGFESVPCPLCAAPESRSVLTVRDRFDQVLGAYLSVARCSGCGFTYLNPRPQIDTIGRFYTSAEYDPFLSARAPQGLWERLYSSVRDFAIRKKRREIERLTKVGTILDVGCGTGEFLNAMRKRGWGVRGIEMDESAAAFARAQYEIEVHSGSLAECNYERESLDVVSFWHVLEHLHDPVTVFRSCWHWLKPDGFLLIAAPNIGSLDAGFYKENWVALDSPRHLLHFTPESMNNLCQQTGFELLRHRQMLLDVYYNCLLSERLIASIERRTKTVEYLGLVRAVLVASYSALAASKWSREKLGSSVFYIIQKRDKQS